MAHREQFLDKICPYPSRFDNHADISKNRLQGSGQWLLTNPQFESWSEGDGSSILWGFGPCEWHIHNTINTSGRPLNADSGLLTSWIRENLFKVRLMFFSRSSFIRILTSGITHTSALW
jgi:hypothetical protein